MLGLVTPLIMLAIDYVLFGGASLERVRDLGSEPLGFRILVAVYSGITEELLYRLFLATFVAWLITNEIFRSVCRRLTLDDSQHLNFVFFYIKADRCLPTRHRYCSISAETTAAST